MAYDRKPLYRGGVVDLGLETVKLPNDEMAALEIVRHPGGAVILAVNDSSEVCLLKQFRHAADGWIWEIPAGTLHNDETPEETAQRELAEEAGLTAAKWTSLGELLPSPGFCTEKLHLFLAQDLVIGQPDPEAMEFIEVHWRPFNQVLAEAKSGEIQDAKTVAALFRAEAILIR